MQRTRVLAAVVLIALGLSAAAPTAGASGPRARKPPNLVGTWTGDYRFPSANNAGIDSHETLVIEHQDGELLWGYDEFLDRGQTVRIPVRGSIDADGRGFGLAETNGLFIGRIRNKNTVVVRFFRTDDKYTSFAATLTRTPR